LFGDGGHRDWPAQQRASACASPLAVPMGLFLTGTILGCLVLFLWRGSQGAFQSDHRLESLFSRESLFLFNNWVFLAATVVVFWGTWAELITGMLTT
ncbi:MAG: hypothetical protein HC915_07005, partial [Anaerolineae bacterium]|nr:hypothetical protein [Anaerolineae bacterium]